MNGKWLLSAVLGFVSVALSACSDPVDSCDDSYKPECTGIVSYLECTNDGKFITHVCAQNEICVEKENGAACEKHEITCTPKDGSTTCQVSAE